MREERVGWARPRKISDRCPEEKGEKGWRPAVKELGLENKL